VLLGLGIWGKFCGELLLTVRRARGEAEVGDGRRLGGEEQRLRCSGLGRNRGWIQGFDSGDRSPSTFEFPATVAGVGLAALLVSGKGSRSAASSGEVIGGRGTFIQFCKL